MIGWGRGRGLRVIHRVSLLLPYSNNEVIKAQGIKKKLAVELGGWGGGWKVLLVFKMFKTVIMMRKPLTAV